MGSVHERGDCWEQVRGQFYMMWSSTTLYQTVSHNRNETNYQQTIGQETCVKPKDLRDPETKCNCRYKSFKGLFLLSFIQRTWSSFISQNSASLLLRLTPLTRAFKQIFKPPVYSSLSKMCKLRVRDYQCGCIRLRPEACKSAMMYPIPAMRCPGFHQNKKSKKRRCGKCFRRQWFSWFYDDVDAPNPPPPACVISPKENIVLWTSQMDLGDIKPEEVKLGSHTSEGPPLPLVKPHYVETDKA